MMVTNNPLLDKALFLGGVALGGVPLDFHDEMWHEVWQGDGVP